MSLWVWIYVLRHLSWYFDFETFIKIVVKIIRSEKHLSNYLFALEPLDFRFGLTTVLNVEGDHLSLLDDQALDAISNDVRFDCGNNKLVIILLSCCQDVNTGN